MVTTANLLVPSILSLLAMVQTPPATMTTTANNDVQKPRILCLHGKFQNGSSFSHKISGARRKLSRSYDLHFLDGPVVLPGELEKFGAPRGWWGGDEDDRRVSVREAFEYVMRETEGRSYDGLLGFSQGGTLAAALGSSGLIPGVRTVVTAGSPLVGEAFEVAEEFVRSVAVDGGASGLRGCDIPKLHLAGERDEMVPVDSTRRLCKRGGNGELLLHDQGHLFPTRALRVNYIMEFLAESLGD